MVLQFSLFKRFRNEANKCKIFEFRRQFCSSDLICQLNFRSSTFTFLQGLCKIMSLHFHVIFGIRFFSVKKTLKSFARLHIKTCLGDGLRHIAVDLMHICRPHAKQFVSCIGVAWPHAHCTATVLALCIGVGLMRGYGLHAELLSSCMPLDVGLMQRCRPYAQVLASCRAIGLMSSYCPHALHRCWPHALVQALCIAIVLMNRHRCSPFAQVYRPYAQLLSSCIAIGHMLKCRPHAQVLSS